VKKICIISDSHNYIDNNIINYIKKCDEVWHAGDIGDLNVCENIKQYTFLRAVYGNIDNHIIRIEYPEFVFFQCEKLKILMTHIGGSAGRYTKKTIELIKRYNPDIFICGHSHILKVSKDKKFNLIHINPGAIGKHGFHQVRTMIMLEIERKKILNMNVIEFKR
tara:strand:+ start:326 stop:817 length:492 start_codon:yes stop_codon:yes gene_type:complete